MGLRCCKSIQCCKSNASILNDASKKTPYFTFKGRHVRARCVSVYDGDTINVCFPLHDENHQLKLWRFRVRLEGIDTPEIKSETTQERTRAIQARDYLRYLILDKDVKLVCGDFDKYGRLLAYVFVDGYDQSLNRRMVEYGHAVVYDGKNKHDAWSKACGMPKKCVKFENI